MTGDEIIEAFNTVPTRAWRHNDPEAIVDGDTWAEQPVILLSDALKIIGELVHHTDDPFDDGRGHN